MDAKSIPVHLIEYQVRFSLLQVGLPGDVVGWEVTASCPCPDGSAPFTRQNGRPCIPDPCAFLKCENFPNAFCITDLCGGCNAVFLLNGQEVDCGNQLRFPGNVTGTSTSTSTVVPPVPGGSSSVVGAQNGSNVLVTSSSALSGGQTAGSSTGGAAAVGAVSGVMIVLGAAVSAFATLV